MLQLILSPLWSSQRQSQTRKKIVAKAGNGFPARGAVCAESPEPEYAHSLEHGINRQKDSMKINAGQADS